MNEIKKPKKKIFPFILMGLIAIGLFLGIKKYIYALHHEDTDDAQIDNDINPVLVRMTGYINEIRFVENIKIHKGDTLVTIDNRDVQIKVKQAEAALENTAAGVAVAESNVNSAMANYETAKATFEAAKIRVWKSTQDFNRFQNLINDKAITQQQFDAAKAEKESADAQLSVGSHQQSAALTMVESAKKQIAVANASVTQRKVDLDLANLQLSYATIIAPVDGIATKKNIQVGQLVNIGSPILAIVSDTNVYVTANFKETQLEDMAIGNNVQVIVDAFPKTKIDGTILSFSAATGAKFSLLPPDNATGNFVKVVQRIPVKIALKNIDSIKDKVRPGMSVKVSVKIN